MQEETHKKFISSEWQWLLMANYEIDPHLLAPYVPQGTELDTWQGKTMVSMVGFLFKNTRLLGLPIPFHQCFEEVNLRFYVKYRAKDEIRRGVVFVRELVPKMAVTAVANLLFNEHYATVPMNHQIETQNGILSVRYGWEWKGSKNLMQATAAAASQEMTVDSEEEFIAEHYWGYTRARNNDTFEYKVAHPRWRIHRVHNYELQCDVENLYGKEFVAPLSAKPHSVFLADGSEVTVMHAARLKFKMAILL